MKTPLPTPTDTQRLIKEKKCTANCQKSVQSWLIKPLYHMYHDSKRYPREPMDTVFISAHKSTLLLVSL